jgi:tetratricopeptide (TPR) repeat protein/DNA-binding XRE family transcriptional regulator
MPRRPPELMSLVLTALRYGRGWSGQELADAVGLSAKTISLYERERAPSRKKLETFATALGYDPGVVDTVLLGLTLAIGEPTEALSPVDPSGEELRNLQRTSSTIAAAAFHLTSDHLKDEVRKIRAKRDRRNAARLWSTLEDLPCERRRLLVEKSREYQMWALAERLAHESAEAASNRADLALELASLAVSAAKLSPGGKLWRSRIEGYCLAFRANAWRVGNDMPAAEEAFLQARELWEAGAPADPGVLPEWRFLSLEGSLRRDERRFDEALRALDRAVALAPPDAVGSILLQKGSTFEQMGEAERATDVLAEAIPLIDGRRDPRLPWILRFNLASSLCDLGRYTEAEELLDGIRRSAVELRKELDLVRVLWLEGKVVAGLGQSKRARASFEQVRREFAERAMPYDFALTTLDLTVLCVEEGRTEEVRLLADEMVCLFKAQGIARETLAAVELFSQAARQDAATVELARRLSLFLGKARQDLSIRFEG